MKRSLRWRLAWSFTLLSTFAVMIQAIALFVSTEEQEEDLIDEVVNTALDNQQRQPGSMPEFQSSSLRMKLYRVPNGQAPAPLPAHFARLPAGNHEWFVGDTEYHVGIRDGAGGRVYLVYDVSEHETRLDQLRWNLTIGLLVLSVVSLSLGYWLAGRMLHQLEKITRGLQRDDSAPLNEPGLDHEVALLADALDQYRTRNRELLAREQEFTANVSHELRTPLTRIRTSAELLTEDAALSGRTKDRAVRIVTAVDAMEARLRGLLFLAREIALDERRPLELKKYVEASATQVRPACKAAGVRLDIDIPEQAEVEADPALLQLLLDNLIGNAARYTPQGSIAIAWRDGELTVTDTGVGIPAEHLAHVFDRHYRASELPGGTGLGLSIVKRVCEAHGWECAIGNVEEGTGTRVAVRFAKAGGVK
jgi:signal transduction histidine kinase